MIAAALAIATQTAYRDRFPLPTATVPDGWGVNLGFDDLTETEIDQMRAMGVRWVRRDLFWHEVETQRGTYDFSRWDKLLRQIESGGIRPIFILCYGNGLYQPDAPRTPEARRAFANYVAAAVRHFRRRGVVWEMWNEPNGIHWTPSANVEDYIALTREAAAALRREGPDEWFVGPALAGMDEPFLRRVLESGVGKEFDAFTVHPYRPMEPESVGADYAKFRHLIDRYAPGRPILSGEWGYSAADNGLGEAAQGDYFGRQYLANLAFGVPMSVWYNWTNNGTDPKVGIENFGVRDRAGNPKPAFRTGARIAQQLEGFRYRMRLATDSPREWILLFAKGDRPAIAYWTTGEPRPHALGPVTLDLKSSPQVLVPDRRNPILDRALALPAAPLHLKYRDAAEFERLVRSMAASVPEGGTLRVRWSVPVVGPRRLEYRAGAPLEPFVDQIARGQLRTDAPSPMRFEFDVPGVGAIRQETVLYHPNPLRAEIAGLAPARITVAVEAEGAPFDGEVRLLIGDAQPTVPIRLEPGEAKTVEIPVPDSARPATILLNEGGRAVFVADARRAIAIPIATATPNLDGDAKVEGSAAAARESFEGRDALRIDYRFGAGWKYALGRLPQPIELPGRPATMGVWVHGDASGALLLMRYVDAGGQTFQPEGIPVDWRGWRRVTFRLRGETGGRWGGANDGVIRYPIRIEHPFVIDNPGGRGVSGTIRLADALVVTEPIP